MQGDKRDLPDMLAGILTFYRPTTYYWRTGLDLFHNHRLFIRRDGGQEMKPYSPILFFTIIEINSSASSATHKK